MIDIDGYLEWAKRRRNERTLELHKKVLGYYDRFLKMMEIDNSPKSVDEWLTILYKRKLQPETIYTYFEVVKQYYKYTGRYDEIIKIEAPRPDESKYEDIRYLKPFELERLVDECNYLRDKAILAVLCDLGLRRSELQALNVTDVDLKESIIVVNRMKRRGKMKRARVLIRSNKTFEILTDYIEYRKTLVSDSNALFLNMDDKRLMSKGIYYIVKKWSKTILGEDINPHMLRHSVASQIVEATGSLKIAAEYLGTTTRNADRYAHIAPAQLTNVLPEAFVGGV